MPRSDSHHFFSWMCSALPERKEVTTLGWHCQTFLTEIMCLQYSPYILLITSYFLFWHHWIFFSHPAFCLVIRFSRLFFCRAFFFFNFILVLGSRSLFHQSDFSSLNYSLDRGGLSTRNLRCFLNDFWFLLPLCVILSRNVESSKDAVSKLSFTLLLFHHIVQLVWYFTHLHLLRFKSRKLSPEDAWHNSISTESLSNLLWMSFLLLYLQIALSLSSELDLSMILFENLSLKFYPLNHPYAVLYNKVTP